MGSSKDKGISSELDLWDPLHDHYTSEINTLGLDVTNDAGAAIRGYQSLLNNDYCQHFAKYGTCMDKEYCRKKHLGPNNEELNAEKEFVFAEPMIRRDFFYPNSSQLLFADVTYIDRPNFFYVMLPYGRKDFRHYRRKDLNHYGNKKYRDSPARFVLDQCHKELKSLYDKNYRHDNINIAPAISQLVAVKLGNGSYCRAVVTDIKYNDEFIDSYEIRLIDTGAFYVLPRERIHPFPARFLSVCPLAVPCRLPVSVIRKSITPETELVKGWPKETMDTFVEFCSGKNLLIRLFHYNDMDEAYTVDLFDYNKKVSLIELLLEKRLAKKIDYDVNDYTWMSKFIDNFDDGFI